MGRDKYESLLEQKDLELRKRDERITELEEENAFLRHELQELKEKIFRPKPPKKQEPDKPEPKKRGALFGHLGWFRKKPKHIDEIEVVRLSRCPLCGGDNLSECKHIEEHIQEDIILPKVKATKYIHHHFYCGDCKQVVSGKGREEIPGSYIGPVAKSIAGFLRYDIKISVRDIQRVFKDLFNLTIVPASVPGFNNQLRRRAVLVYKGLKDKIRRSKCCHADETGWKLDGHNQWLWSFSSPSASFFHIDESRGQKVVEEILGDKYNGVLVSDFLSAYNKIEAKGKQRCLIHLVRDLKKVRDCSEDASVKGYCQSLMGLLAKATELDKDYKNAELSRQDFEVKRQAIADTLRDFNFPDPNKRHLKRLAQRIIRHKDELLTFLYHPNVSFNNNKAERHIRPNVIFRKITFGNRSTEGTLNHSVLMSVLQTAKLNKLHPLRTFKKIFTLPEGKRTADLLIPP